MPLLTLCRRRSDFLGSAEANPDVLVFSQATFLQFVSRHRHQLRQRSRRTISLPPRELLVMPDLHDVVGALSPVGSQFGNDMGNGLIQTRWADVSDTEDLVGPRPPNSPSCSSTASTQASEWRSERSDHADFGPSSKKKPCKLIKKPDGAPNLHYEGCVIFKTQFDKKVAYAREYGRYYLLPAEQDKAVKSIKAGKHFSLEIRVPEDVHAYKILHGGQDHVLAILGCYCKGIRDRSGALIGNGFWWVRWFEKFVNKTNSVRIRGKGAQNNIVDPDKMDQDADLDPVAFLLPKNETDVTEDAKNMLHLRLREVGCHCELPPLSLSEIEALPWHYEALQAKEYQMRVKAIDALMIVDRVLADNIAPRTFQKTNRMLDGLSKMFLQKKKAATNIAPQKVAAETIDVSVVEDHVLAENATPHKLHTNASNRMFGLSNKFLQKKKAGRLHGSNVDD